MARGQRVDDGEDVGDPGVAVVQHREQLLGRHGDVGVGGARVEAVFAAEALVQRRAVDPRGVLEHADGGRPDDLVAASEREVVRH